MGHWKLVRNGGLSASATEPSKEEIYELFYLEDDPFEKTDLAKRRPDKLKALKERLAGYLAEAAAPNIPPNRPPYKDYAPKI